MMGVYGQMIEVLTHQVGPSGNALWRERHLERKHYSGDYRRGVIYVLRVAEM